MAACLALVWPALGAPRETDADTEEAARALERVLVTTGALLLPAGQFEIAPGFFYARSEQQAPVVFNTFIAEQNVNSNILGVAVQLRYGLPADTQLELGLPYRYAAEETVTSVTFQPVARTAVRSSGLGDVSVGIAKVLMIGRGSRPNLVARLTWDSDTGENDDNVVALGGSGFNEAQFSLVATHRQDPLLFVGGLSYQKAFEKDDVQPGDEVGLSLGVILAASPETSLRVTLDQTFIDNVEIGGTPLAGTRTVVGAMTFGASWIVGAGKLLDFTLQSGLTDNASDFVFGVSIATRFGMPRRR
jgi:hypothetical protein